MLPQRNRRACGTQRGTGVRELVGRDLGGRSRRNDLAARGPGSETEVDDVIGPRDHRQVVFDDDHATPCIQYPVETSDQDVDIRRV